MWSPVWITLKRIAAGLFFSNETQCERLLRFNVSTYRNLNANSNFDGRKEKIIVEILKIASRQWFSLLLVCMCVLKYHFIYVYIFIYWFIYLSIYIYIFLILFGCNYYLLGGRGTLMLQNKNSLWIILCA